MWPFNIFNKRARLKAEIVKVSKEQILIQLSLSKEVSKDALLIDNFVLGYIYGVHDASFQRFNMRNDSAFTLDVIKESYEAIWGEHAAEAVIATYNLMSNELFNDGLICGGSDFYAMLKDNNPCIELAAYLHENYLNE